jgi:hypothetical protein
MRVITTELATTNNHESPTYLGFCLLHCCATKASSSHSSMLICDRESRSSELLSSTILHRERANKIYGKRSSRLLARFFKFFIITHLPLYRTRVEGHRLQANFIGPIIIVKEPQITYVCSCQIMSYILDILTCVGMILLDNLL